MEKIIKLHDYGYREEPIIEGKDYLLGGFSKVIGSVLNESGNWLNWKPEVEVQVFNNQDTFACTSFGTTNCLEILLKFMQENGKI